MPRRKSASKPDYSQCEHRPYRHDSERCNRCGKALPPGRSQWCSTACNKRDSQDHYWPLARKAAIKRDKGRCLTCESSDRLEVNHIEPRLGQGYNAGCWHHPENLETLCHDCHVKVTNSQRKARAT